MDAVNPTTILAWAGSLLGASIALLLPWELWRLHRQQRLDSARLREMPASACPLLPTLLLGGVVTAFITALFAFAASLAPWKLPVNGWSAALALVMVDFLYYWDHRVAHRNRSYWALAHSVHHSSPQYDQTTGLRRERVRHLRHHRLATQTRELARRALAHPRLRRRSHLRFTLS